MILGSLSSNAWGCVLVLLVVWHGVSSTGAAGCWVELGLSIETEISGKALADWYYVGPGGLWWSNVLNSAHPPQRIRPATQPEHQDPVSHTAGGWASQKGIRFLALGWWPTWDWGSTAPPLWLAWNMYLIMSFLQNFHSCLSPASPNLSLIW